MEDSVTEGKRTSEGKVICLANDLVKTVTMSCDLEYFYFFYTFLYLWKGCQHQENKFYQIPLTSSLFTPVFYLIPLYNIKVMFITQCSSMMALIIKAT